MGKRGPAPMPSNIVRMHGNPGKRPLNRYEPQPKGIAPQCPQWLSREGRKLWRRLAPELKRLGLLTIVDGPALTSLCEAYAEWRQAAAIIRKEGLTLETPTGYLQERPEVAIAHKAQMRVKAWAAEFGLTPASRSRISVNQKEESEDPMEDLVD